jgi:hypothetical protein
VEIPSSYWAYDDRAIIVGAAVSLRSDDEDEVEGEEHDWPFSMRI